MSGAREPRPAPPVLVVLAGGASARLGRCKALVELGEGPESTPLARLVAAGAGLGVGSERAGDAGADGAETLVVTGAAHDEIAAACAELAPALRRRVTVVRNPRWAEGRAGSVLAARDARPGRDLCLAPVDVPLVTVETFAALGAAWRAALAPARGWLAPRTGDGRFGHPIVVGRALVAGWRPADRDTPLRELRAGAEPLLAAHVDDPRVHDDLDRPEDLSRLRSLLGG